MALWERFYQVQQQPSDLTDVSDSMKKFCEYHSSRNTNVVLVTSGGTTVPLEHNTVRFIDNFSAGTRGSASAENFIKKNYAVIFMHRNNTLLPFARHFSDPLNHLEIIGSSSGEKTIRVSSDVNEWLLPLLEMYKKSKEENKIMFVTFKSLTEYLFLLKEATACLSKLGPKAILYLAAAVSDFYIPHSEMPEHKIQSADGPLNVTLEMVPKMLCPLVKNWAPDAFTISFKLETDSELLVQKSKAALQRYGHQLVIANLLQTRKRQVWLVNASSDEEIFLTSDDNGCNIEIEEKIIERIVRLHQEFVKVHLN